jgi:histidinol-phosphatase (PHP family)
MPAERLDKYLEEIAALKIKYSDLIQVYTGLEIDYISGLWGRNISFLKDIKLDYFIGSVHYAGFFEDGTPWTIDGDSGEFFRGLEEIFDNDARRAVTRYYEWVREMVEKDRPSIIGHLDKIKMHNRLRPYMDEREGWYISCIEETLDLIAASGSIVEVNTRGIYRYGQPELYPSRDILERMVQKDIPVMIHADAHLPDEIEAGHKEASALLKEIGYDTVKVLLNNRWIDCEYDETGIIIQGNL